MTSTPKLLPMGVSFDDRGSVRFLNGLEFSDWKRFYIVSNFQNGFVRSWHAHRLEAKLVFVLSGSIKIGLVPIKDFETPDPETKPIQFVLTSQSNQALYIPAGYANGFKTLQENTQVFFFSSASLEESKSDDFRYPWDFWHIWNEDFR
jgi:dTDP-4-dehydrorhamnose 3,5-epimerase-like enzyme